MDYVILFCGDFFVGDKPRITMFVKFNPAKGN